MTFPTGQQIPTTNLDSPDDDPSLARADLYDLVLAVNRIIASANAAQGVVVLDGSAKVPTANLSGYLSVTGDIELRPSTGVVNVTSVLRLAQLNVFQLGTQPGTTSSTAGDLVYLLDGDAGQPCIGVYDGTNWRVVRLMTQVGDVGGTLTAAFTLTATADA
jgi:hypothetical protein